MTYRSSFVCVLAVAAAGCVAAKPAIDEEPLATKTEAVVGAACLDDSGCAAWEFCDVRVCIPEAVCEPGGFCAEQTRFYDNETAAIPDNDPRGVERAVRVLHPSATVARGSVHVTIDHTYRGDLRVVLRSPSGTEQVLHDRAGGGEDDLFLNVELSGFAGEPAAGEWTLVVSDHAAVDTGVIRTWRLELEYGAAPEPADPGTDVWAAVELSGIESAHDYEDHTDQTWDLRRFTGAGERVRLHFARIDVEQGYDFVEVLDAATGAALDRFTGAHEDLWTREYETAAVSVRLVSDYSVVRWGFALDGLSVFGSGCLGDADCGEGYACPGDILCVTWPCFQTCQPAEPEPVCEDGETMDDGCNGCVCSGGLWVCTRRACEVGLGETCGGANVCAAGLVCDRGARADGGPTCGADYEGVCVSEGPTFCRAAVDPVCACTGQTFDNHCSRIGSADFASEGRCELALAIPDADARGVSHTVRVERPLAARRVRVQVEIDHTWRGDLIVTVEAPDGSRHTLTDRQGDSADDFDYDGVIELSGSVVGTWTLLVSDHARYDTGTIRFFNVLVDGPVSTLGQTCGTRGAVVCASGEVCQFVLDTLCGAADQGGTCVAAPDECSFDSAPVCGCDGRTYHNTCRAHAAGVSVSHEGACAAQGDFCGTRGSLTYCHPDEYCHRDVGGICGWADAPGECRRPPEACVAVHDPVCGCDSVTYANECEANRAGVSIQATGACAG